FALEPNRALVRKLADAGVRVADPEAEEEASALPRPFEGMTFVITGTLPTLSRNDAKTFIEERGGRVTGSVSSKYVYGVVGEDGGSKWTKARQRGVETVDEDALRQVAAGRSVGEDG